MAPFTSIACQYSERITESLVFAHGVTPHTLGRLQLATIQRETFKSGDQTIEIGRIMITDARRRTLETFNWSSMRESRFRNAAAAAGVDLRVGV
jgi:hypothetical protein